MLRKTFLALLLLPLLVGCGNGEGTRFQPLSVTRQSQDFEMTTTLPKGKFALTEIVPITITVKNIATVPKRLEYPNFFAVYDGETRVAWGARGGGAAINIITLQPNEQRSFDLEWNQRRSIFSISDGDYVPSGYYQIRTYLPWAVPEGYTFQEPLDGQGETIILDNEILIFR